MTPLLGTCGGMSARGFGMFGARPTIQYVGRNTAVGNLFSSTPTYTVELTGLSDGLGGNAQAGDLVIVYTGWTSQENLNGNPGVTTSGYTELTDLYELNLYSTNYSLNWKIMPATPDTVVTCNARGIIYSSPPYALSYSVVHVFRNVNQLTPIQTFATAQAQNQRPDPPAVTPTTLGSWICHATITNGSPSYTATTDMTRRFNDVSASNDFSPSPSVSFSGRFSYKSDWVSGTFNPQELSIADDANVQFRTWCSSTFVINPI
jgi:hypothetical protein